VFFRDACYKIVDGLNDQDSIKRLSLEDAFRNFSDLLNNSLDGFSPEERRMGSENSKKIELEFAFSIKESKLSNDLSVIKQGENLSEKRENLLSIAETYNQ
jgi:hypothetical protein